MLSLIPEGLVPRCLRYIVPVLLFLMASTYESFSQNVASPYQVGTWQGFRSGAVSYTFDDNLPNQLAIAVPMFDQFGFKVTLFTVTGPSTVWAWPANWSGLQNAAAEGHEIASHTIDHPSFDTLADSAQKAECALSQDTIDAHIPGHQCITIAYPYCVSGNEAIDAGYYIAGRGCSGQIMSNTPGDFMNISSFVCGNLGLNTVAAIEAEANSAAKSNGWCAYLMHAIIGPNGPEPNGYSPISPDTILATLQFLHANPNKFWVAPFGTVARYIKERNSVSVSEISNQGDSIVVQLTDNLDSAFYNIPLTIRRPLPDEWDSAIVCQNGDTISSTLVKIDTVQYVMFDAAPDTGNITIINETTTIVGVKTGFSSPVTFGLLQNYPNPFNPTTNIEYRIARSGFVSLKVYDMLGRQVAMLINRKQETGQHIAAFNANNLPSGVYFYRLSANGESITKKLVLIK
ncbi:MAG: T9SS type A sorting domain-containing protein [Candidatus Kryptoniota bacterium]